MQDHEIPEEVVQSYYKSMEWKRKRAEQLEYDRNRCATCGSTHALTVHHKPGTISRIGSEEIGRDLITLCAECHAAIHKVMRDRRARGNTKPQHTTNNPMRNAARPRYKKGKK